MHDPVLYTIIATLAYDDLPTPMKEGWSSSFGSAFLDYVGDNPQTTRYMSLNGRICQKCVFIGSEELAEQFAAWMQAKLDRRKRPITVGVRRVKSTDLNYRRKTAVAEAQANDAKILELMAEG